MPLTEAKRLYLKEYRQKNKAKIRVCAKARYLRNREKRLAQSKAWKIKHKEYYKKLDWAGKDRRRFGGNKQKALERDNFECQKCGMNQEQSIILFGQGLVAHHIDGQGYGKKIQNNSLDNLQTLCFRCHTNLHRIWEKQGRKE